MVDAANNGGPLAGYVPVDPVDANMVIGPYVEPPPGAITVHRPRAPHDAPPVELSTRAPSDQQEEDAWETVERKLPSIDRGYTKALIATRLYAQRGVGTPPIVVVTGPTGAAKTALQHLAAGMTGTRAGLLGLDSSDDTLRRLGLLITGGAGIVFADEVGRIKDLYWKLEPLLRANSTITFRAKYANESTVPLRVPISLLGSTLPPCIVRSPEIARRSVGYRLRGAAKNWRVGGMEIADARTDPALRTALDVITSRVWWDLFELGPDGSWRDLCLGRYGAVEIHTLDLIDPNGTGRDEAVRKLYETFRTAKEDDLTNGSTWRGWLVANPKTPPGEVLGELVDFEAHHEQTKAESAELERLCLEAVLGFPDPTLHLLVRRRSGKWLVKFIEEGVRAGGGQPRSKWPSAQPPSPSTPREKVEL